MAKIDNRRPVTHKDYRDMKRLSANGKTYNEIAAISGYGVSTVNRVMNSKNLKQMREAKQKLSHESRQRKLQKLRNESGTRHSAEVSTAKLNLGDRVMNRIPVQPLQTVDDKPKAKRTYKHTQAFYEKRRLRNARKANVVQPPAKRKPGRPRKTDIDLVKPVKPKRKYTRRAPVVKQQVPVHNHSAFDMNIEQELLAYQARPAIYRLFRPFKPSHQVLQDTKVDYRT